MSVYLGNKKVTLNEVKASNVKSETATSGQVLTADGQGGASFQDGVKANVIGVTPTKTLNNIRVRGETYGNELYSFQGYFVSPYHENIKIYECTNNHLGKKIIDYICNDFRFYVPIVSRTKSIFVVFKDVYAYEPYDNTCTVEEATIDGISGYLITCKIYLCGFTLRETN